MNATPGRDGNVIYGRFAGTARVECRQRELPECSVSCHLLHADEMVALVRLVYRINGQMFVQHVMTEAEGLQHG